MTIEQRVESLLADAFRLPNQSRAAMAEALIRSLDAPSDQIPEDEARRLWIDEARRRAAAYDAGELSARDWEDVKADLKAKLQ